MINFGGDIRVLSPTSRDILSPSKMTQYLSRKYEAPYVSNELVKESLTRVNYGGGNLSPLSPTSKKVANMKSKIFLLNERMSPKRNKRSKLAPAECPAP